MPGQFAKDLFISQQQGFGSVRRRDCITQKCLLDNEDIHRLSFGWYPSLFRAVKSLPTSITWITSLPRPAQKQPRFNPSMALLRKVLQQNAVLKEKAKRPGKRDPKAGGFA